MSTGNQFALIPWRAQIRSGGLRAWPDAAVSILPVLAVHESPLLEAWPSQTRIASLAGVSKTTLGAGLRFLVEQGWISLTKRKTFRAWHTVYRMEYLHYRKGYPAATSLFLALPYTLVLSGVWGKMSGATKRLYLVLRAHCVASDREEWTNNPAAASGSFLPVKNIQPGKFADLAEISDRMYRKGIAWLIMVGVCLRGGDGLLFRVPMDMAAHSVLRSGTQSTTSPFEVGKTAHSVPREEAIGTVGTASGTKRTASGTESTVTISSITSIKEEIREIPVNMKREPLPLPGTLQTGAHVRNTPNARRRTGERDGKATVREGSEEGRGADFEADLAMLAAVQAQLERQRSTEEARQG